MYDDDDRYDDMTDNVTMYDDDDDMPIMTMLSAIFAMSEYRYKTYVCET